MAIVATEIVSDEACGAVRYVTYRCQDSLGEWHQIGPLWAELTFDAEAFKTKIAERVWESIVANELEEVLGNG